MTRTLTELLLESFENSVPSIVIFFLPRNQPDLGYIVEISGKLYANSINLSTKVSHSIILVCLNPNKNKLLKEHCKFGYYIIP